MARWVFERSELGSGILWGGRTTGLPPCKAQIPRSPPRQGQTKHSTEEVVSVAHLKRLPLTSVLSPRGEEVKEHPYHYTSKITLVTIVK
jgi:hypothetical protein